MALKNEIYSRASSLSTGNLVRKINAITSPPKIEMTSEITASDNVIGK